MQGALNSIAELEGTLQSDMTLADLVDSNGNTIVDSTGSVVCATLPYSEVIEGTLASVAELTGDLAVYECFELVGDVGES